MKAHPSGRPIRREARIRPAWERPGAIGFRLERLNPPHIRQATDTFAMGFVDHRAGVGDDTARGRR